MCLLEVASLYVYFTSALKHSN